MRYIRKNNPKSAYDFRTHKNGNNPVESMVELDWVLLKDLRNNYLNIYIYIYIWANDWKYEAPVWDYVPISMAARSKAWVCGRSPARILVSNPAEDMEVCLLWVLFCRVEFCVSGWSLDQRNPTDCGWSVSLDNEQTLAHLGYFVTMVKKCEFI
jgi:hypothetical protein